MLKSTLLAVLLISSATGAAIKTVHFESEDGKTRLVAYLFEPAGRGQHPAVVMLHGRAGPYSSLAKGVYDADTLSKRHVEWGNFWAERGYLALLVDSFGPRGYPEGFPAGSYKDRPESVSEQTVRPLDAYGALRYLRGRKDVFPERVGVQGWSNGAMTVLVTMKRHPPGIADPTPETGFRVALAEYPGCGMEAIAGEYRTYAHLAMAIAAADAEVSPARCKAIADKARRGGTDLSFVEFAGAEHNYDDPSEKKQSNPANRRATEETKRLAERLFAERLGR